MGPKEDAGIQEKAVYFAASLTQRTLENSEGIDAEMALECSVLPAKKGKIPACIPWIPACIKGAISYWYCSI